jgi:hypothetical protein
MHIPSRPILTWLTSLILLLALGGCGNEKGGVADIVGASQPISRDTLNHWMRALAASDFREATGRPGPVGLVAEPANNGECVSAARSLVPRSPGGTPKLNEDAIASKCHALYRSVKEQALIFLIGSQWNIVEAREHHLAVSNGLLRSKLASSRTQVYPDEAQLHDYLGERRWILADLVYQLRDSVLSSDLLTKFDAQVTTAGGGEATYTKLALARYHRLVSKTTCKPGYVVADCKEYQASSQSTASGETIISELVHGAR